MAPASLDTVLADAAKQPHSLLAANFNFANFRTHWIDWEANGRKGKSTEKSKGLVYLVDSNTPATLIVYGVVDGDKSKIGDYGGLWTPGSARNWTPDLSDLAKAKFIVFVTYPYKDKVSKSVFTATSGQVLRLNKLQQELDKAISEEAGVLAVTEENTTDWVEFEKGEEGFTGSVKMTLGDVYMPATVKVKGKDVTELSPSKRKESATKPRCDAQGFFDPGRIPKSNSLQPIDKLPVYLADGKSAEARDAQDLQGLLYGGRWVRAEVQMVVWNIKGAKKNTRTFKLEVIKLSMLPTFAIPHPTAKYLKANELNAADGSAPANMMEDDSKKKSNTGEEDDTVSDSDKSKDDDELKDDKKRKHDGEGPDGSTGKVAKTGDDDDEL